MRAGFAVIEFWRSCRRRPNIVCALAVPPPLFCALDSRARPNFEKRFLPLSNQLPDHTSFALETQLISFPGFQVPHGQVYLVLL